MSWSKNIAHQGPHIIVIKLWSGDEVCILQAAQTIFFISNSLEFAPMCTLFLVQVGLIDVNKNKLEKESDKIILKG